MENNNNTISYPHAYGYLDGGLRRFAESFEIKARASGHELDSFAIEYLKEELEKLADSAHAKGIEHFNESELWHGF